MVRARPVVFGLVFAFGFLQREFTVFAVLALVGLEVWTREIFTRRRLAHWAVVLLVFLGAREGVGLLRGQASMFGPQTSPVLLTAAVDNVDVVAGSVCLSAGNIAGNVAWLVSENVPTFFGVKRQPAGAFIVTAHPTGVAMAWPLLALALGVAVVATLGRVGDWWAGPAGPSRTATALETAADDAVVRRVSTRFAWFLLLTGLLSLAGVAAGCNVRSLFTIRYHLMLALAPVGVVALAFAYGRRDAWRLVMAASVVAWAVTMAASSLGLWREYRQQPPPDPFRVLADDLVAHGESVGWATYWVSYHVDFLSQERVQLSPTGAIRITDYARQATRAGRDAITVGNAPCDGGRQVAGWWVCRGE